MSRGLQNGSDPLYNHDRIRVAFFSRAGGDAAGPSLTFVVRRPGVLANCVGSLGIHHHKPEILASMPACQVGTGEIDIMTSRTPVKPFRKLLSGFLVAVISLAALSPAVAVPVAATGTGHITSDLYAGSDSIVAGTVTRQASEWNADRTRISTRVTVAVKQTVKGPGAPDTIEVSVPGGEVGEIGEWVSDSPRFDTGEDILLYLKQSAGAALQVYGGSGGKLSLPPGKVESMSFQELEGIAREPALARARSDVITPNYLQKGHKWPGASPTVSYRVNPNTADTSGEETAVQAAAATWTAVTGKNFAFSYAGATSATAYSLNGTNEILWKNLGDVSTLAHAIHWYNTSTLLIVEADIEFNEYYNWAPGTYDIQSIALHEMGHWLFLGDLYSGSDTAKVMYGYYSSGTLKRVLHSDDIAGIRYLYPAPSAITVTAPNGGESWAVGSSQTITWTSSGISGMVKIEVSRNSGASYSTLISSTANDGSHPWTVAGPGSTTARVKVTSISSPGTSDSSNADFTITGPPPPTITLTAPNGGESWDIGTVQDITWTSSGLTGMVKIEVSRNSGSSWSSLISSTANDGSHPWTVTGPGSTTARIKVTSVASPTTSDSSNADFIIPPPSITVTSPNGGEVWAGGSLQTITWTSSGVTGMVKIEISRNGGSSWTAIVPSTTNDGDHAWTVAGGATSLARIRVSAAMGSSSDSSDANFTVLSATGFPADITSITVARDGTLYAAAIAEAAKGTWLAGDYRLLKSTNGGMTWGIAGGTTLALAAPAAIVSVVASKQTASRIYVAVSGGGVNQVRVSTNSGTSFALTYDLPATAGNIITMDVTFKTAHLIAVGTDIALAPDNIQILDESTAFPTWQANGDANITGTVNAVAFSPNFATDNVIFAVGDDGLGGNMLVDRRVGAGAWATIQTIAGGGPSAAVSPVPGAVIGFPSNFDFTTNNVTFVGLNQTPADDLYKVSAGSSSPVDLNVRGAGTSSGIASLSVSGASAAATLLVGLDTTGFAPAASGAATLRKSLNSGAAWSSPSKQPLGGTAAGSSLTFVARGAGKTVYAGTSGSAVPDDGMVGDNSGFFVSLDAGSTFTPKGLKDA